jgi:hypothetical protein
MILAKYKKQIGEGFFAWSLCIALTGTAWMLKGRSPLAWPNVWGVIDWLAWAAIAIAIFQVAGTQLSRELPNRSRLQDALHLLGFFALWLAGVGFFCAIAAVRIYLYVYTWNARPDIRLVIETFRHHQAVKISIIIFLFISWTGILTFLCRMIAVLTRRYDDA